MRLILFIFLLSAVSTNGLGQDLGFASVAPSIEIENINWSGPQSSVDYKNQVPTYLIDGQRYPVVMVAVNPQANYTDSLEHLRAQVDLAIEQGFKVIELVLPNHSLSMIQKLESIFRSKDVYILLRFDLWSVDSKNILPVTVKKQVFDKNQNKWVTETAYAHKDAYAVTREGIWQKIPYYSPLSRDWLIAQKNTVTRILKDLQSTKFSSKIMGFKLAYMEGGEWFESPYAKLSNNQFTQSNSMNEQPWTHPELFYLGDYSQSEQSLYTEWLKSNNHPLFIMPSYVQRITPKFKGAFLSSAASTEEQNVLLFRQFQSERLLWVQQELAKHLKQQTQGRALVAFNNAYLYSLAHSAGSTHAAVEKLFNSKDIDIIAAPYNYSYTRRIGEAFIPHGPSSSARVHNKLWLHEDDSRPYWHNDPWRTTQNHNEDISILLRNTATSLFHGNGLYYLDLENLGWFGNSAKIEEATKTWNQIRYAYRDLSAVSKEQIVNPEVAVFVDEKSYYYLSEFGINGQSNYAFTSDLMIRKLEAIAKIGAPVRYYLTSDLSNCETFKTYKFFIFLNQFEIKSKDLSAINTCLKNQNRMLYFQHATGLYGDDRKPSTNKMAQLIERPVTLSSSDSLQFNVSAKLIVKPNYQIYYEPNPAEATVFLFRDLASRAGVHLWSGPGSVIDGFGDKLMIHSNESVVNLNLKGKNHVYEIARQTPIKIADSVQSIAIKMSNSAIKTRIIRLESALVTPAPNPVPPPPPSNSNPPLGLFREGYTGYIGNEKGTYCVLHSGEQLRACGYTQVNYDQAKQVKTSQFSSSSFTGQCACGTTNVPKPNPTVPVGLFRDGFGGYIGSSNGRYCGLTSGEHLKACGYTQLQYNQAKQFALSQIPTELYTGACVCSKGN